MTPRRLTASEVDPATVHAVLAAARQTQAHDDAKPLSEQAELRLRHGGEATHLLIGHDAYAQLAAIGDGVTEVEGFVVPGARRQGLAGRLLADLATAGTLRAWAHGDHPGARRLAARVGAKRVRELRMMTRPSAEVPHPSFPDGVTLRSFQPGIDDGGWLAVNAAAFADHPEQGRWTAGDLHERMAEPWFDAQDLLIATDGEGIAGFHWTKLERDNQSGDNQGRPTGPGEVYVVGVAPRSQGTGLGRALTLAGLRHLTEAGARTIELYVDADNLAAARLYQSLGFATSTVDVQYEWVTPTQVG